MLLLCGLFEDDVPHGLTGTVLSMEKIIEVTSDESRLSLPCNAVEQASDGAIPSLY